MNSGKFPSALVQPFSFLQKSHCSQLLHPCRGLYTWEQRELDRCTESLPKVQEVTGAIPETEGTSPRVTAGDGLFLSFPLWWQTVIKGHQYMTKTRPVPDKQEEETINGTRVKSVHGPAGGNESKQHTLKIKNKGWKYTWLQPKRTGKENHLKECMWICWPQWALSLRIMEASDIHMLTEKFVSKTNMHYFWDQKKIILKKNIALTIWSAITVQYLQGPLWSKGGAGKLGPKTGCLLL